MKLLKIGLLILLGLCFPAYLWAAPQIANVEKDPNSSDRLIITGSEFGTHPDDGEGKDYLCRLWDDFEGGAVNVNPGYWDAQDASGIVMDSSSINRANSSFTARQVRGSGKNSPLGHSGDISKNTVYMYAWRHFCDFQTVTYTNSKAWRIWPSSGMNDWVMVISGGGWQNGSFFYLIESITKNYSGSFGPSFLNSWHCYEVLVDQENNRIQVWIDGNQVSDVAPSSWGTWDPSRIVFDAFSHETDEPYTYTDDCYISHTQARVMIGNRQDFASANLREIQIPYSWSDGSIIVALNKGAFGESEQLYLFVIDSNGDPSAGYPITLSQLGAGTAADGDAPYASNYDPEKAAGNVPVDTTIAFNLRDSGDGVDASSIVMRVQGEKVNPVLSGSPADYKVTYKPTSPFSYGEEVRVEIESQDLHSPPNVMPADAYSFITGCDPENLHTKVMGDGEGSDLPGTVQDTYLNINDVNYSTDELRLCTYTWPANTPANRIVMKWDLSAFPEGIIVQSAWLELYMHGYDGAGGDDTYEIGVHKIMNHNPVIAECTWYTYDGVNNWSGGSGGGELDLAPAECTLEVDKSEEYKSWDVTEMVQEWLDNPSGNFGLMLNSDASAASDSNRYFRPTEFSDPAQRPRLVITYCGADLLETLSPPSAPAGLKIVE